MTIKCTKRDISLCYSNFISQITVIFLTHVKCVYEYNKNKN